MNSKLTSKPKLPTATIRKAGRHVSQNEGLIFEKSAPGKRGMELPPLDVPAVDPGCGARADFARDAIEGFPEVSEIEVIRHFTRLSTWNYAIDLGMYPLGSCTMKYNPRVNEYVARLDGLASEHPAQPAEVVARLPADSLRPAKVPARNHRHGRGHAAARRRRAGRTDRPADDSRVSREPGQCRARKC